MDALSQASIIEDDEVSNDLNSDLNSIRMVLSKDFHYNPNYNYENYDVSRLNLENLDHQNGGELGEQTENQELGLSAENIAFLLKMNQEYQEILKMQLKRIEYAQLRNEELKKKVRMYVNQNSTTMRKMQNKRASGTPYFADSSNEIPPPNPDAIEKQQRELTIPTNFKFRKWNQTERKNLARAVRAQNHEILMNQILEEYQRNGKLQLEDVKREMEEIRAIPPEKLELNVKGIEWDRLAKTAVPTRSGIDCKIQWLNEDHPSINKEKWTKEEDKVLLAIVKKHKGYDWVSITKELNTNRTPCQCFKRYQRSLNTNMVNGKWTKQEDKDLETAIKLFGDKNWQQVANYLIGRTGQQCLHRWQKTVRPNIKRGRWTLQEDKSLTLAVKAYGSKNWIKVQQHVPGRTDVQCRERWVNILDPSLNNGPWTKDNDNRKLTIENKKEDKKLQEATEMYGLGKWSQVALLLAPRTDNQCWRRWKALNQEKLDQYRQQVMKKRIGMVNNFVGREKERPNLSPDDFDITVEDSSANNLPKFDQKADEIQIEHKEFDNEEINNDHHHHHHSEEIDLSTPSFTIDSIPLSFGQKDYPDHHNPAHPPNALPFLLPTDDSMTALQRLATSLSNLPPSKRISDDLEGKLLSDPEYIMLSGVFNSIFLCPMLVYARHYCETFKLMEQVDEQEDDVNGVPPVIIDVGMDESHNNE